MNSENGRLLTSVILQQVSNTKGSLCAVQHKQPILVHIISIIALWTDIYLTPDTDVFFIPPNIGTNNAWGVRQKFFLQDKK